MEIQQNGENIVLRQIQAKRDIPNVDVQVGTIGGWIQSEECLSHDGDCWIDHTSKVFNRTTVIDDAQIRDSSIQGNHVIGGSSILQGCEFKGHGSRIKGRNILIRVNVEGSIIISGETDISHTNIWGGLRANTIPNPTEKIVIRTCEFFEANYVAGGSVLENSTLRNVYLLGNKNEVSNSTVECSAMANFTEKVSIHYSQMRNMKHLNCQQGYFARVLIDGLVKLDVENGVFSGVSISEVNQLHALGFVSLVDNHDGNEMVMGYDEELIPPTIHIAGYEYRLNNVKTKGVLNLEGNWRIMETELNGHINITAPFIPNRQTSLNELRDSTLNDFAQIIIGSRDGVTLEHLNMKDDDIYS